MCMYSIMIGTFLMNSLLVLVLFYSGANRSFVSQSVSKDFVMALGMLDCPLRVPIANEHKVSTLSIFVIILWRRSLCPTRLT